MKSDFFYITSRSRNLKSVIAAELYDIYSLWKFRTVVLTIVKRNVYQEFHQTILGPFWLVLQPLLQSVIFTLIFGKLANISTDGVSSFFFYNIAIVTWTLFTSVSGTTAGILVQNKPILSKIYVPKLLFPTSNYIYRLSQFFINLVIFAVFYIIFEDISSIYGFNLIKFIYGLFLISVTAVFSGLFVAAITTIKRDLLYVYTYFMQALMYLSPVIYPLSTLSPKLQLLTSINPISTGIELIRSSFFSIQGPSLTMITISTFSALTICFVSYCLYARAYKKCVDTL